MTFAPFDLYAQTKLPRAAEPIAMSGTTRAILHQLCRARGVTLEAVLSPCRKRAVAHVRQECATVLRGLQRDDGTPRYSLPRIGRMLGGLDHSSVLYSIRAHAKRQAVQG